jgi:hypothetical protein
VSAWSCRSVRKAAFPMKTSSSWTTSKSIKNYRKQW